MSYKNVTINGIKMPISNNSTIKDIIDKFFNKKCEFLVNQNGKPIPLYKYQFCKIKENDMLQIITYSEQNYQIKKRTIMKQEPQTNEE